MLGEMFRQWNRDHLEGRKNKSSNHRNFSCDNRGFSLIELIVTVLVMSILAGGAVMAISQISNTNVTTTAEKLMEQIDQARYENLFLEGDLSLEICYEDENYFVVTKIDKDGSPKERQREKIADSRLSLFATESTGTKFMITELTPVVLRFQKSTGAFRDDEGILYSSLEIESSSRCANIALVSHTGRCFLEVIE